MISRSLAVLTVFFALIPVCVLSAQTFRGSIQGTIMDSTGAAIPGANVKVFSPGTGWHNVTSTFNYTWAHSIDTASGGLDFVPNAAMPDNSFNRRGERASSNFDLRQRVQWYWTYNLPKFHQRQKILNGWAVDGMFNFANGQPYTVSYLFKDDYNGTGKWFGRPDMAGNPNTGTVGANLLNLAAFAAPCTVDTNKSSPTYGVCLGNPGSGGRNAFNSPNYTNADFSPTKTSHLTEKASMELRGDFFNIFIHPNFSNPLLPGFGVDLYASSTRFINTAATPEAGSGNPYLGGGGPRSMQCEDVSGLPPFVQRRTKDGAPEVPSRQESKTFQPAAILIRSGSSSTSPQSSPRPP